MDDWNMCDVLTVASQNENGESISVIMSESMVMSSYKSSVNSSFSIEHNNNINNNNNYSFSISTNLS